MYKLPLFLLALACMPMAFAGECRDDLRPLLLDSQPDHAALQAVRATCAAEAEDGDPMALYQLALFHLGLGGEWQPDAAIPLIRDAAAAGISEAQYWLAWQHEDGPLLEHDTALALSWYQRAANANHRLAVARLARAYEAGELGLSRDRLKALEYRAREAQCQQVQAQAASGS